MAATANAPRWKEGRELETTTTTGKKPLILETRPGGDIKHYRPPTNTVRRLEFAGANG